MSPRMCGGSRSRALSARSTISGQNDGIKKPLGSIATPWAAKPPVTPFCVSAPTLRIPDCVYLFFWRWGLRPRGCDVCEIWSVKYRIFMLDFKWFFAMLKFYMMGVNRVLGALVFFVFEFDMLYLWVLDVWWKMYEFGMSLPNEIVVDSAK